MVRTTFCVAMLLCCFDATLMQCFKFDGRVSTSVAADFPLLVSAYPYHQVSMGSGSSMTPRYAAATHGAQCLRRIQSTLLRPFQSHQSRSKARRSPSPSLLGRQRLAAPFSPPQLCCSTSDLAVLLKRKRPRQWPTPKRQQGWQRGRLLPPPTAQGSVHAAEAGFQWGRHGGLPSRRQNTATWTSMGTSVRGVLLRSTKASGRARLLRSRSSRSPPARTLTRSHRMLSAWRPRSPPRCGTPMSCSCTTTACNPSRDQAPTTVSS